MKQLIFGISLCLFCLNSMYGQKTIAEFDKTARNIKENITEEGVLDRLKSLYDSAENLQYKEGKKQTLYLYANHYLQKEDFNLTADYLNKILHQFKPAKNDTVWGDALSDFGTLYFYKGVTDSSIVYFSKAKEHYETINYIKGANRCLNNLGILSAKTGNMTQAAEYFSESLSNFKTINDTLGMINAYNNLGLVYGSLKDYESEEKSLLQALNLSKAINNIENLFNAYLNLGVNLVEQKKFRESLTYYNEAYKYCDPKKNKYNYALLLTNHGVVLMELYEYDEAEKLFFRSLELKQEMGVTNGLEVLYLNLASIAEAKKEYQKALKYLVKCQESEQISRNVATQINAKQLLTQIYIQTNNTEKALESFDEYMHLKENYFNEEQARFVKEIETRYKVKETEQEKELAQQTAIMEAQDKKIYLIVLVAIVALVIMGSVFIYLLYQKRKKEEELKRKTQLAETIYDTEEKEKSRIAKDLHDGIVQDLTAFKMGLNVLAGHSQKEYLEKLTTEITTITNEVRELSYQMMPVTLKELGLEKALNELLGRSLVKKGIKTDFNSFGFSQRLSEKTEVTVYRICQELINNTIKHSNASSVSLLLRLKGNILQLTYEDNGKGFSPENTKKGIGLNSLENRIEAIKGSLSIESSTLSGTTAYIRIPVEIT